MSADFQLLRGRSEVGVMFTDQGKEFCRYERGLHRLGNCNNPSCHGAHTDYLFMEKVGAREEIILWTILAVFEFHVFCVCTK